MARGQTLLAAALLAAALPGCGGGGSVTAPPVASPSPVPVTTVVLEGTLDGLPANRVAWGNFQTAWSGRLEVIVDWTSSANNVDVFLTFGLCNPDQLLAATCTVVGTAESPTAKPERITVEGAANGLFTLFVVNLGPGTESSSYRVQVTH
jgi:hypothetical protein